MGLPHFASSEAGPEAMRDTIKGIPLRREGCDSKAGDSRACPGRSVRSIVVELDLQHEILVVVAEASTK